MKYWKRTLSILIIFALSFGIFAGCTPESGIDVSGTHSDSPSQSSKFTDSAVPSDPSSHAPTDSAVPSDPSSHTPTDSAVPSDPSSATQNTNETSFPNTTDSEQVSTSETKESPETEEDRDAIISSFFRKRYCVVSIDEDFEDNEVSLRTTPAASVREYTVEDFADVGCTEILYTKEYKKIPGTNIEVTWRFYVLKLATHSKENVINAIRILEQRDDVFYVRPMFPMSVDAVPINP